MRQYQRKADFIKHPVGSRIAGFRFTEDLLQIVQLVKPDRCQTKKLRSEPLTAQFCGPHMQVHEARVANGHVFDRIHPDRFAVQVPDQNA